MGGGVLWISFWCETPKSPPGDYNGCEPQKGICGSARLLGVKHLNPRQGITTRGARAARCAAGLGACVKHLNPRQGITTWAKAGICSTMQAIACWCETPKSPPGDYNALLGAVRLTVRAECETPKSPPGE